MEYKSTYVSEQKVSETRTLKIKSETFVTGRSGHRFMIQEYDNFVCGKRVGYGTNFFIAHEDGSFQQLTYYGSHNTGCFHMDVLGCKNWSPKEEQEAILT